MRWPLDSFVNTQGFHGITKTQNWEHWGNDLAAGTGVPIKASESGVAVDVYSTWKPGGYFGGNYVKIKADSGYSYYMGHMNSTAVSEGQRVSEGQIIGYIGSTGQATGPHTHFEMYNSGGKAIDATKYINGGNMDLQKQLDEMTWKYNQSEASLRAREKENGELQYKFGQSEEALRNREKQVDQLENKVKELESKPTDGFKPLGKEVFVKEGK